MKKNFLTLLAAIICFAAMGHFAIAQLPNLIPQNINLNSTTVSPGGTLTVTWALANTGSVGCRGTVTGVRINQSSTSHSGTTLTNVPMPALGGYSSTSQSATLIVPTTPGTYYVWIIADNVSSGGITQSSYLDDEQHSFAFTIQTQQLPNLVPQNIILGSTTVAPGGPLPVSWTIANSGVGSSPGTVTGVRINQSSTSFSGTTLTNVSMPPLSAYSSTAQSATVTAPTAPGTYYVWIIADNVISGAINQSNYSDDEQHPVAFTVAPPQYPDLLPQNIILSSTNVQPGGTLGVNWSLANTGNGYSPGTVTGVRINQSTISYSGTTLTNVPMAALTPYSSTTQSAMLTVPTTPGTYYVWVIADNVTSGGITQSNYANDEQHSVAFTVAPPQYPDLVPQNIILSSTNVQPGVTLAVGWSLANSGNGNSPGTVTGVRINQSTTSFSGTTLTNVPMAALTAYSSTNQSATLTVPTTPGTYYVWIIADNVTSGGITQSNYSNDEQHSIAFTVSQPQMANLVPQNINLSATTVQPGGTLSVGWNLANTGSGNSPATVTGVRINQSTSSFSGTTLTNVPMPAVGANSSTAQNATLTVPTTPGTYYVWIIADNVISGAIPQSNYTDDEQHSIAFTVVADTNQLILPGAISYIRQINKSDLPPGFNDANSCGPISVTMACTYYNRLSSHPIIGQSGHANDFSWYVAPVANGLPSSTAFSGDGFTFNIGTPDVAGGTINYGAFGYLTQDFQTESPNARRPRGAILVEERFVCSI